MWRQPINIYADVKVVALFGWLELLVLVMVSKNWIGIELKFQN